MTLANPASFEILSYEDCVAHLKSGSIGRLAWVRADSPVVVPVNYAWDGEAIVMRSDPGAKLDEVTQSEAAFEVDQIDGVTRSGWSVLAVGRPVHADPANWSPSAVPAGELSLETWVPGSKDHWIRLVPRNVSGRRLTRAHASGPAGSADHAVHDPYWRLAASE